MGDPQPSWRSHVSASTGGYAEVGISVPGKGIRETVAAKRIFMRPCASEAHPSGVARGVFCGISVRHRLRRAGRRLRRPCVRGRVADTRVTEVRPHPPERARGSADASAQWHGSVETRTIARPFGKSPESLSDQWRTGTVEKRVQSTGEWRQSLKPCAYNRTEPLWGDGVPIEKNESASQWHGEY